MFQKKLLGVSLVLTSLLFVFTGTAVLAQAPDPLSVTASVVDLPVPPDCGLQVQFDGTASGGTPPYMFEWNFNANQDMVIDSTEEDPVHTYAAAGEYDVTLAVTDAADMSVGVGLTVEVFEPVSANASADPLRSVLDANGEAAINFTGDVSPEGNYTFAWDFGDGNTSDLEDPGDHTYMLEEFEELEDGEVFNVTFTATNTDTGCVGMDEVTVVVSSEEAESAVGNMVAAFFELTNDEINELRDMDWGWGGIAHAYWLAKLTGEDVETIVDMREGGMGWGPIVQAALEDLGLKSLGGFNLGAIMSGHFEALLEECGLSQEELVALVQEFGAGLSTIRHACRLAAQAGEGTTAADVLALREELGNWGKVRQALNLAAQAGGETSVEDIMAMLEEGMNWGQIRKQLAQGEEEATEADSEDVEEEEASATSERGNRKKERRGGDELTSGSDDEESTTTVERGRGKSKKNLRGTRDRGPRSNRGRGRR
ncbi:MAG: PKD domain-containing protein [Chloroflexi bacterium]|nr:PKD domain-containing protein [Chloroflexota bacterium]